MLLPITGALNSVSKRLAASSLSAGDRRAESGAVPQHSHHGHIHGAVFLLRPGFGPHALRLVTPLFKVTVSLYIANEDYSSQRIMMLLQRERRVKLTHAMYLIRGSVGA